MNTLLILPALNEEGKIGRTVEGAKGYVSKVLVIDDGSTDSTSKEANDAGALVLKHKTNQGVGAAIKTGIKYALQHNYDVCVVMGGDNQDSPEHISDLLDAIDSGADFVQGSRYLGTTKNMPLFRRVTTTAFSLLFSLVVGRKVTDASTGFRAFKTKIFDKIDLHKSGMEKYEFEPYIMIKAIKLGYNFKEVPAEKRYFKGFTKMVPFMDWYRITKPLIFELIGIW